MKVKTISAINSVPVKRISLESPEIFSADGFHIQVGPLGRAKFKGGLRQAIRVEDQDWVWLTADFSSEEMCLLANYSKDPGYIEPLQQGNDIHMHVAKKMFGYEDPNHRTAIKTLNFACNYGAGPPTIARKLSCTVQYAKELLDKYQKTLGRLTAWKQAMCKEGRRKGLIFTYFGRPRLVFKYYQSSDKGLHGYADRTCVNHAIQGCVPIDSYIELDDRVVAMKDNMCKKLSQGGHEIILSHRSTSEIYKVVFRSGDFIFCNYAHGFIYNKGEALFVNRLSSVNAEIDNILSPLSERKSISWSIFRKVPAKVCVPLLLLKVMKESEILNNSKVISTYLYKAWLFRKSFTVPDKEYSKVMRLRSLAGLYGYNLVNIKRDVYKLRRSRPSVSKIREILPLGIEDETVTATALNGFQTYHCCGVLNKNTGGDIIRIVISKFYKKYTEDSEFGQFLRDNVRFLNTVHDEINLMVRPAALYRVRKFVHDIMYFSPSNFVVPIKEEPGVAVPQYNTNTGKLVCANWGTCLDFDFIDEDNRIHIKEYEDSSGDYVGKPIE